MDKSSLMDSALAKLMGDMDSMEGDGAMKHSMDECPDPLTCTQHDDELGESLTKAGPTIGEPGIKIEIHKGAGIAPGDSEPSREGVEDSLNPEEIDALKKLLK